MTRWKSKMVLLFLFGSIFMAMAFSACDSTNPPVSPTAQAIFVPTNTPCANAQGTPCTPTVTLTLTTTPIPTATFTPTATSTSTFTSTVTLTPTITNTPCYSMGQTVTTYYNYFYGSALVATRYNLPAGQTIHNLWVPVYTYYGGLISAAIYGDSGLGYPGSLFVQSASQPMVSGLNKIPISPTALPAGNYWLAVQIKNNPYYNYYSNLYYSNSGLTTDQYATYSQSYGSFPPPGPHWYRSSGSLYSIMADSCP